MLNIKASYVIYNLYAEFNQINIIRKQFLCQMFLNFKDSPVPKLHERKT